LLFQEKNIGEGRKLVKGKDRAEGKETREASAEKGTLPGAPFYP
jgi:hypothetical protein